MFKFTIDKLSEDKFKFSKIDILGGALVYSIEGNEYAMLECCLDFDLKHFEIAFLDLKRLGHDRIIFYNNRYFLTETSYGLFGITLH